MLIVKDNQPTLKEAILALNLHQQPHHHQTFDKAHGRTETRRIWVSSALNDYLDFPQVAQVFVIEREVLINITGQTRFERVCGITSLTARQASAEQLLHVNRKHWGIENQIHWVRDVTFDEDRSTIRTQQGPQMMACLRNLVISLLRLFGVGSIAAALRYFARRPRKAIQAIGF